MSSNKIIIEIKQTYPSLASIFSFFLFFKKALFSFLNISVRIKLLRNILLLILLPKHARLRTRKVELFKFESRIVYLIAKIIFIEISHYY